MSIVAVFNQKGGVGKTTTCLNVTASLALLGRNPLAIDLDPQSHLTLASGLKAVSPSESVSAFFREDRPLADLVHNLPSGMRLIPAHPELAKIDALYGKSSSIAKKLDEGLQIGLAQEETPVLIDCCPMLGVLSLNAVFAADRVLIPVSADFLSLQGVHRLDAALKVLEGPLKRRIEKRIVITRFDGRRKLSHEIYQKLIEHFGDAVCETRISETVGLAESPARGQDIFAFAPHSKGAQDYGALAMELLTKGFFQ